jgi:hypothetical protein
MKIKDKNTHILNKKYDDRTKWLQEYNYHHTTFPSNKEFKILKDLMDRKFNDKIWWKLLSKEDKLSLIRNTFISGYDPYNISKEQMVIINSIKQRNPLTKEIRDFKIKLICS